MPVLDFLSNKRRLAVEHNSPFGQPISPSQMSQDGGSSLHAFSGTGERAKIVPNVRPRNVAPGTSIAIGSSPAIRGAKRPLAAKQGTTSTTLAPLHTFPVEGSNEIDFRADAIITFVTSINANQPVASIVDRLRVYETETEIRAQIGEIEGRALPASAYMNAHMASLLQYGLVAPGRDAALANTSQQLAYYKAMGGVADGDYLVEDVIKAQPFLGVGAASAYSENDGSDGRLALGIPNLGSYWLARSLTVNQVGIQKARAFLIASATDLNSGFTIRAGGRSYVTEEINSIEDQILDEFGTAPMSITGAAGAAPAGHGVRGAPQDPFTGASVFMFSDIYDEPTDISIIVSGAAALLQIVAITEGGLGAIKSA